MPSIDDIYGEAVAERRVTPAVVMPPQAVIVPGQALTRFLSDPAGLKHDALNILNIKIATVETREAAASLSDKIAQAETLLKNIEARRVQHASPLFKEFKDINAEAKRWSDPIEALVGKGKKVLAAFLKLDEDRVRRQAEEQAKKLEQAAVDLGQASTPEAQDAAAVALMKAETTEVDRPIKGFKTDNGSLGLRKTWKVEVVDASLVPPNYLVPDLKALQAAVNAGARQIDGCNIFEDESVTVRTR
jgi:hypothetical protein